MENFLPEVVRESELLFKHLGAELEEKLGNFPGELSRITQLICVDCLSVLNSSVYFRWL